MELNQCFHEDIAKLCLNHFETLPKTGKPTSEEWTIMSCIVKEENSTIEVVSLGTGSKCIGRNSMSPNGDILNDSHAEIICRRSFLRYIYSELNLALKNNNSIFKQNTLCKKFNLRDGIEFHLFTTHVPCGDAAIFPKEDVEDYGHCISTENIPILDDCLIVKGVKRKCKYPEDDTSKTIKVCGTENLNDIYRTGAKCLPHEDKRDLHLSGAEYHTLEAIRTKPGRGDPTLSVSCSDKIVKWTYLGIQGALLCLLIEKPIYIKSLTIAGNTPYSKISLERALYSRFKNDIHFDDYFHHQPLTIGQTSQSFKFAKDVTKSSNRVKQPSPSSIIWCLTHYKPLEVAVEGRKQGITKKHFKSKKSLLQIAKKQLFIQFCEVYKNSGICKPIKSSVSYKHCKQLSVNYQKNWTKLKDNVFKVWTIKNADLLNFFPD